jgi:hypothetical protein
VCVRDPQPFAGLHELRPSEAQSGGVAQMVRATDS